MEELVLTPGSHSISQPTNWKKVRTKTELLWQLISAMKQRDGHTYPLFSLDDCHHFQPWFRPQYKPKFIISYSIC
ncbi:hypothetical protein MPTK1_6g08680 [Marchantia polymorpha subsp. ruderalis]|uniref:Uncharacterized protein n=2 Tax=Marchantia polymorpha TaxID=3197 RepID=A0AAF6BPZ5_MARPO|nr:hypothetical protein MARPO_0060s0053 [Marchantia polymorpha]BBN14079.1 hypothetical protein Mp_6g08680 [Marchantia polymorpha subsp. ruderalis]|eukprot:PTQ36966.1 hypothetical protein MARPO_0060s0053 [Marchantia polymorpha]